MSTLADVRFTVRNLRRSPAFTAAALITIGLGIGAVTAVMTLVNAVLVRPLPFGQPDRIVYLGGQTRERPRPFPLGYQDVRDLEMTEATTFAAVSPVTGARSFNLTAGTEVEHITGEMVGAAYFDVLGVGLQTGRMFTADEARPPAAASVAVIAYDLWERRFQSDPAIVGRTMELNDRTFEIVGVAAPGFRGLTDEAKVWLPIGAAHGIYGPHYTDMRMFRWLGGVARMRDGVTLERAEQAVRAAADRMTEDWPKENGHMTITTTSLGETFFGDIRLPLLALLGASAFVLLIGCVNVSNLLLARGASRQKELALRLTLGAGRRRLIRQLLTESLMLVALGAAAGIALAWMLTRMISTAASAELASFVNIHLDLRVLAVTALVSAVAAVLFGLMPALTASRLSPIEAVKEGGRGSTIGGRRRLQGALVAVEVMLSLVLLAGAALMTKGFSSHLSADLGFEPANLLTMRLDLTAERYRDDERYWQVARGILERAGAVPGVQAVTIEGPGYPTGGYTGIHFRHEGAAPEDANVSGFRHHVTPGYFGALGIPLLAGRDFDTSDRAGTQPVLVVSEGFARRYWPGENPVGRRLLSAGTDAVTVFTIVGVVGDVQHAGFQSGGLQEPDVYVPLFQYAPRIPPLIAVMARVAGDATAAIRPLQHALREAAPDLPAYDVLTMEQRLGQQTARGRYAVFVMSGFAVLALVLASVGLYGLISYNVVQRTREIGIRLALGASRSSVLRLIVSRAAVPMAIGIAGGIAAVVLMGKVIAGLLYGLDPLDPWVIGGAVIALTLIGLAAACWPAMRAARVDPLDAMRSEA